MSTAKQAAPARAQKAEAEPLTDEQVEHALWAGGIPTQRFMGGISGTKDCWLTAGPADIRKIAAVVRKLIAPVAQAEPTQAQQAAVDHSMCPHQHSVDDWRLHRSGKTPK
jgi:hypothetical protein